jgi:TolB-like protein
MKNKPLFTLLLFQILLQSAGAQTSIAIVGFENRSNWMFLDSWAEKIPDYLQHELSGDPRLVLVERTHLKSVFEEQALKMSGLADSARVLEVGQMISAQYMLTGTVDRDEGWIRIQAKVINTETGKVFSEKVQSREPHLDEMVSLLGHNLKVQLTGQGTYHSKMKIHRYPLVPVLGVTLGSGLITAWLHHNYTVKRQDYQSARDMVKIEELYQSANRNFQARNWMLGVTGAAFCGTVYCWLKNVSPEEILAADIVMFPVFTYRRGETQVGFQIHF